MGDWESRIINNFVLQNAYLWSSAEANRAQQAGAGRIKDNSALGKERLASMARFILLFQRRIFFGLDNILTIKHYGDLSPKKYINMRNLSFAGSLQQVLKNITNNY